MGMHHILTCWQERKLTCRLQQSPTLIQLHFQLGKMLIGISMGGQLTMPAILDLTSFSHSLIWWKGVTNKQMHFNLVALCLPLQFLETHSGLLL